MCFRKAWVPAVAEGFGEGEFGKYRGAARAGVAVQVPGVAVVGVEVADAENLGL